MTFVYLSRACVYRQLRNSNYAVWILILPPVLYVSLRLLWPNLASGGTLVSAVSLFLSATAGIVNQPLLVAQMREEDMLKRFAVTPLLRNLPILATAFAAFVFCVAGLLVLSLAAWLFGDLLASGFARFFGGACFIAFGLVSAGIVLPVLIQNFIALKNSTNTALLLLFVGAGIFFRLPGTFSVIHSLDPLSWLYGGLKALVQGTAPHWAFFVSVCALAVLGMILFGVIGRRSRNA